MASIRFNTKSNPFFDDLKQAVDGYFNQTGKERTGNWVIYLKSVILLTSLAAIYTTILWFQPMGWWGVLLCVLLGFTLAGIGFNVMHDSAHGSFSKYTWVNNLMSYSLNIMGGDVHLWKAKHNLIHHSYTNVEGFDDDIDIRPLMRLNEHQEKHWFHRFQHIYGILLYALNYFVWVFYFDYQKYFSRKIGETPIRRYSIGNHVSFWITKLGYYFVYLVIPMMVVGVLPTLIGYLIATVTCGLVIGLTFQLAHVVEDLHFQQNEGDTMSIPVEWAVHQVQTTSNFATRSWLVNWCLGGLNHQVEHHLFPRISHVHYRSLGPIVKRVCERHGIVYHEHRTVLQALRSHFVHLRDVGRA
jgi:linoleoyl-CoA desaturase